MTEFFPPGEDAQQNADQLNLFLSTLFGGKSPKIRYGVATVTFPGAVASATALAVNHGLGTTPVSVQLTGAVPPTVNHNLVFFISAWTATTFTFTATTYNNAAPAVGTQDSVAWFAIG